MSIYIKYSSDREIEERQLQFKIFNKFIKPYLFLRQQKVIKVLAWPLGAGGELST